MVAQLKFCGQLLGSPVSNLGHIIPGLISEKHLISQVTLTLTAQNHFSSKTILTSNMLIFPRKYRLLQIPGLVK